MLKETALDAPPAAFRPVDAIFRPRSIAVLGASAGGWSKLIFDNLRAAGADVEIYPINPKRDRIWDERCYASFDDLPGPVDLALAIVPAPAVAPALRAGRARGLRAATVYAAGFGEGGDAEGLARADELAELARDGLRICGPNGMGTLALRERLLLYPQPRVRDAQPGNVALAMQSGGLFQYWVQQAAARGLGFSYAVSVGNEVDCDLADYVAFFVDDPSTSLICCFAEGIRRPDAFCAAAERALAARKPILMVKSGRSADARAAVASHTGSLAGDDRVFDAVCERYGIVRCASLDELIENALAFRSGRLPSAEGGVMMVGYSGAARGLLLDAAAEAGLAFATLAPETADRLAPLLDPGAQLEMPIDLGAAIAPEHERFARICTIVAEDPQCALLGVQAQLPIDGERPDPQWLRGLARATTKPVFAYARIRHNVGAAGRAFQAETGIDAVHGIGESIRAAQHLTRYAERARRGVPARTRARAAAELGESLRARGIGFPAEGLATNAAEAGALAARIGFPVAVKLHAPTDLHKTELGGVRLGLRDAAAAATAAAELLAIAQAHPALGCDGVLVQTMVDGLETIVGARCDPQFGPVILAGLGGVFVEAFDDVALRLLPVDLDDAQAMIAELRGRPLLGPFRGRAERDVGAFARAIVALGETFLERTDALADLEINPLIVLERGRGVCAVDVRAVARPA